MTSRLALTALLALFTSACAARQLAAPPMSVGQKLTVNEEVTVTRLSDRVYVVTHLEPWAANALLVEMKDSSLVFVNTLYHPEAARALLRWARNAFGERRMIAIDTHFHPDALGGNEAFLEAGVPVYGADLTVRMLAERGERIHALMGEWLAGRPALQALHRGVRYVPPDHVFPADEGLSLDFGGETLRVLFPGPAHAPDNVVVYFPEQRVLFGGCMVISAPRLGNLSDADLQAWPRSLEKLRPLGAERIIPGHGERFDAGLLKNTADVLAAHPEPVKAAPEGH
jgi:metallo-beta-lactamase class B